MPKLTGQALKALKVIHLFSVCSWLGGGLALMTLTAAKYAGWIDGSAIYGADVAAHIIDRWVVVNFGAFLCLGTGFIYALFTPWGFFRHRWITVKWAAIIVCIGFGIWLGGQETRMLDLARQLGDQALLTPEYLAVLQKYGLGGALQVTAVTLLILVSVFRPWKGKKSGKQAKAT